MKRGEVWTVADEQSRWRVVVLSADEYNERRGWAYCVPIVRRVHTDEPLSPYVVSLNEPDPISGLAIADVIERLPITTGTERVGMVTGATLERINEAFRDIFDM